MSCCPKFANPRNSARRSGGGQCCHFANPLDKAGTKIADQATFRGDAGPVFYSSKKILREQVTRREYLSPFTQNGNDNWFC